MAAHNDSTPGGSNHDRLTSWKEIGTHLHVSGRTAQRWEIDYGLPVHRRKRSKGEVVYAFRSELDEWSRRLSAELRNREGYDAYDNGPVGNGAVREIRGPSSAEASAPSERWSEPARDTGVANADPASGSGIDHTSSDAIASAPVVPRAEQRRGWLRRHFAVSFGIVIIATAAIVVVRSPHGEVASASFDWRTRTLKAMDSTGRTAWEGVVHFTPNEEAYALDEKKGRNLAPVVEDLDGDGRKETLLIKKAFNSAETGLLCFDHEGRQRWSRRPSGTVSCGTKVVSLDEFSVSLMLVGGSRFPKSIWLVSVDREFPTVVQRLSPAGEFVSEVWLNGHVRALAEHSRAGKQLLLAGGISNDPDGNGAAVLTMIDPEQRRGAVTALKAEYRCGEPSAPAPFGYVRFPLLDTVQFRATHAAVEEIHVRPDNRIDVVVSEGLAPDAASNRHAGVKYTLDLDLNVLDAVIEDDFKMVHTELEQIGRLDHRCGNAQQEGLWNIQAWREGKPVAVHPPGSSVPSIGGPDTTASISRR